MPLPSKGGGRKPSIAHGAEESLAKTRSGMAKGAASAQMGTWFGTRNVCGSQEGQRLEGEGDSVAFVFGQDQGMRGPMGPKKEGGGSKLKYSIKQNGLF